MNIFFKLSARGKISLFLGLGTVLVGASLLFFAFHTKAVSNVYHVRIDGNDVACAGQSNVAYNPGGSQAAGSQNCAFRTIQKAADSLIPGDDISIHAGTYAPFTLWGVGGGTAGHVAALFQATAADPTIISGDSSSTVIIDGTGNSAAIYSHGSGGSSGATRFITFRNMHLKGGVNAAMYLDRTHSDITIQDIYMDGFQGLGGNSGGTINGGRHASGIRDAAIILHPNYYDTNITVDGVTMIGGPYYCAASQSGVSTLFCGVDGSAINFNGTGNIRRVYAEKFLGNFLLRAPQNGVVEYNTVKDFFCDSDDGCIQLYNVANATIRYNTFVNTASINDALAIIRLRRSNVCTTMPSAKIYNNTFIGNPLFGERGTKAVFDIATPTYCEYQTFCPSNPAIGTNGGCSNLSLVQIGGVIFKNNIISKNFGRSSAWGSRGAVTASYCPPSPGPFTINNNLYYNNWTNYTVSRSECMSLYGPFEVSGKMNVDPQLDVATYAPAIGSPACSGGDATVDGNQGASFIGSKPCGGNTYVPPPPSSTCGNGVIETGEQCDGGNLGGASCVNFSYSGGTLSCTSSCQLNTSACTSVTPPPPSPTTSTLSFRIGDRIQTTGNLNVRSIGAFDSVLLGTQLTGSLGSIAGGPSIAGGYTWWQVNYDNSPDGWSIQDYLRKTTTATNKYPTANAGVDQVISLPTTNVSLNGTASDDALPNPPGTLSYAWNKMSGPGTVTFGSPNSKTTTATLSTAGIYVLRFTASDSVLSGIDEVQITVNTTPPSTSCGATPLAGAPDGYGAATTGGNGYPVVCVTNLNDSGSGSLRAALGGATAGAGSNRRVHFSVSGTINLLSRLDLHSQNNVTIDGSTAPSPGVTLRGNQLEIKNSNNVTVRHLRIRDAVATGPNIPGITVWQSSNNVWLDHLSVSGATDDAVLVYEGPTNVTLSWILIANGAYTSVDPSPEGMNISGSTTNYPNRVTVHHTLLTNNFERNPSIGGDATLGIAGKPTVDFRNNIVHNWGSGGYGTRFRWNATGNVVNNIYLSQNNSAAALLLESPGLVYVSGNQSPSGVNVNSMGTTQTPIATPSITQHTITDLPNAIFANVGALPRDSYDAEVITNVRNAFGSSVPPPVADVTPPTNPLGLTAVAVSSTIVNLSWTASTDAVGVTGYNIMRGTTNGGPYTKISSSVSNGFSNTTVSPATTYYYVVQAYDVAGNVSGNSNQASVTTPSQPIAPPPTTTPPPPSPGQTYIRSTAYITSAIDNQITGVVGNDQRWNRGGYNTIAAGRSDTGGTSVSPQRTLIKFDLTSIPKNATIVSASLRLYCLSALNGATNSAVNAYPLLRSWSEGDSTSYVLNSASSWTYSSYPTTWGTPGAGNTTYDRSATSMGSNAVGACANTLYPWNLNATVVKNWVRYPLQNYGMVLVGAESLAASNKFFASSEYASVAYRPKLVVLYDVPAKDVNQKGELSTDARVAEREADSVSEYFLEMLANLQVAMENFIRSIFSIFLK